MSEKYETNHKNPDLFYNRAMVQLYLENFSSAHSDLMISANIDSTLNAKKLSEELELILKHSAKQLKNQCGIKQKKLLQITASIPNNLIYKDFAQMDLSEFSQNKITKNKFISAKIIQLVPKIGEIPVSLFCCDYKGFFFILSVYNLDKIFVKYINFQESNIVIFHPYIVESSFSYEGKKFDYYTVKATELSNLLLDDKNCSIFSSTSELSSKFFS